MEKKYKFVDADANDQVAFKKEMDEVLNKLSLGLSLAIIKKEVSTKMENGTIETYFVDQPTLIIQKRIEEVEAEIVSPVQQDDLAKN